MEKLESLGISTLVLGFTFNFNFAFTLALNFYFGFHFGFGFGFGFGFDLVYFRFYLIHPLRKIGFFGVDGSLEMPMKWTFLFIA